jgi:hypothetical protein
MHNGNRAWTHKFSFIITLCQLSSVVVRLIFVLVRSTLGCVRVVGVAPEYRLENNENSPSTNSRAASPLPLVRPDKWSLCWRLFRSCHAAVSVYD